MLLLMVFLRRYLSNGTIHQKARQGLHNDNIQGMSPTVNTYDKPPKQYAIMAPYIR